MNKIFISILVFCLFSFTIITQFDFLTKVQKKLNEYINNYPEKVYIHTDKPFYSTNDDLWFSAYLVNGVTHQKTSKSKVLHVELINSKDSIVAKRKLFFKNTVAAGDFKINENWEPGNYILRAYTKYMIKSINTSFFQKEIPIYAINYKKDKNNTTKINKITNNTPSKDSNKKLKPKLTFYPEGGHLISGILNKVAFEIKGILHSKINLKGTVKDAKGNEIIEFKTLDRGLGSFNFTPKFNKTYYASIYINNQEVKYPLLKSLKEGHVLRVNNIGKDIIIHTESTLKKGLQDCYLIAHQRGNLFYSNYEKTKKKTSIIKMNTQKLADGVVHITLFDKNAHPVAERLVFIDHAKNKLKLNITTSKKTFATHKKVNITIDVLDKDAKNIKSNLSIAIRDLNAYPHNTRTGNIKSWLLLNSDIKGSIKNPGYFFEKENNTKKRYLLDLLMMTHGWRRFTWMDLFNKKSFNHKNKPETGLYITGTTKQLKKPYNNFTAPVKLTFFGKNIFHQAPIQQSDSLGKFKFGPYDFFDSIPVIIESRMTNFKSNKRKARNVIILIDKDENTPKVNKEKFFNKKEIINNDLQIANFIKITKYIEEEKFKYNQKLERLNEIVLVAKRKSILEKRQDEMNELTDYGEPFNGNRLDLINEYAEPGSQTAFNIVGTMRNISILGDSIYVKRSNHPAKIVLDNLEVDASFLHSINGDEISFIDVLIGSDAATFTNAGNGVIALYSNNGNIGQKNIVRKPGIIDFQAKGFYTARKFYIPDPTSPFNDLNKVDLRTTLFWEPTLQTMQNKSKVLSFYTSDIRSDYIIEIEGISENGIPIHGTETFNVE